jgi:L-lactate dehydrogenase complex protein LldG
MSGSREAMLAALRVNRPQGDFPLPELPIFPQDMPEGALERFAARVALMGGHVIEVSREDPLAPVREDLCNARVCACLPEWTGNVSPDLPADELAKTDFAVVRAAFGVAETGSVLFTERELPVNSIAYLAEHLIVLLDADAILPDIASAYLRPEFHQSRYAVFHTGPSATADIEGVLILGAQGVRSLRVLVVK